MWPAKPRARRRGARAGWAGQGRAEGSIGLEDAGREVERRVWAITTRMRRRTMRTAGGGRR
jgi:hypothetical protein